MTREEFKKACEESAAANGWDRRVMFYEFDTVIEAWFYKDGRDVAQGYMAHGADPVGIPPKPEEDEDMWTAELAVRPMY